MTARSKTKNHLISKCKLAFHSLATILALSISASTDASAMLAPGNAWSGPTQEPGPVGSPSDPRYTAKVIGFINAVPHEDVTSLKKVDIQAFHIAGINRVEGSVDGGSWVAVTEITYNEQSGCWGYVFEIDPNDFSDGVHEARFIAYPNVGKPFLFNYDISFTKGIANYIEAEGWHFHTNRDGSLPNEVRYVAVNGGSDSNNGLTAGTAFKTISKAVNSIKSAQSNNLGGATIYLLEGDYAMPSDPATSGNRWFSILGAPGTNRDNVRITSGDDFRFHNAKLRLGDLTNWNVQYGTGRAIWTWRNFRAFGGPVDYNLHRTLSWKPTFERGNNNHRFPGGQYQVAPAGQEIVYEHCYEPSMNDVIVRNAYFHNMVRDVLRHPRYAINVRADWIAVPNSHSDIAQWHINNIDGWRVGESSEPCENICLVNVSAATHPEIWQGAGSGGMFQWSHRAGTLEGGFNRIAYINVEMSRPLINNTWDSGNWFYPTDHFLMWNCTFEGGTCEIQTIGENWSFRNNYFLRFQTDTPLVNGTPNGQEFRDNHFQMTSGTPATWAGGQGAQFGNPLLNAAGDTTAPDALDPQANSPLILNPVPAIYPVDALNRPRGAVTARGSRRAALESDGDDPIPPDPEDPQECIVSGSFWQNQSMPAATETLVVEYDAIPQTASIDGLTTLSAGSASSYNDCAILVRFNHLGFIDARDGNTYDADTVIDYVAGNTYHFRVAADIINHVYSVGVRPEEASNYITIATDYSFRSTQLDVDRIDYWSAYSSSGSHDVCDFDIGGDQPCAGDVNASGSVNFDDITAILSAWGNCSGVCAEDVDGDGDIGYDDLVAALASFELPCG